MKRLAAVSALLLTSCATVLSGWKEKSTPPPHACTVREIHSDWEGLQYYDAAGHLLFGQTRLTYDGGGFERFSWEGDRLKAIESFYEERETPDYTEGGSRAYPVQRTHERAELEYNRAGQLRRVSWKKELYMDGDRGWEQDGTQYRQETFEYEGRFLARVRGGFFGCTRQRFEWKDGQLLRVFGVRSDRVPYATYEWENGQLAAYHQGTFFVTHYTYDPAGRLVREETSDLTGGQIPSSYPFVKQWEYDAAGRVTRHTRTTSLAGALASIEWHYDAGGRLVEISSNGGVVRYTYAGECDQVRLGPRPPNPLESAMACIESPGGLYSGCF
jgi:YD repeat-containing protein